MNTNHTPGPWNPASTGNHQGLVISEANGANVAVTYDKEDAALVAAAPDLLIAIGALLAVCDHRTEAAAMARAAIQKARGE